MLRRFNNSTSESLGSLLVVVFFRGESSLKIGGDAVNDEGLEISSTSPNFVVVAVVLLRSIGITSPNCAPAVKFAMAVGGKRDDSVFLVSEALSESERYLEYNRTDCCRVELIFLMPAKLLSITSGIIHVAVLEETADGIDGLNECAQYASTALFHLVVTEINSNKYNPRVYIVGIGFFKHSAKQRSQTTALIFLLINNAFKFCWVCSVESRQISSVCWKFIINLKNGNVIRNGSRARLLLLYCLWGMHTISLFR